jgi:hypothetical protein
MTGFEIRFKDETVYASVDEGMVFVIVSYCQKSFTLHIRGYDKTEFINWYGSDIDDADEIIIKVVDVVQNSESKETISKELRYYYDLKQRLEKEGLI